MPTGVDDFLDELLYEDQDDEFTESPRPYETHAVATEKRSEQKEQGEDNKAKPPPATEDFAVPKDSAATTAKKPSRLITFNPPPKQEGESTQPKQLAAPSHPPGPREAPPPGRGGQGKQGTRFFVIKSNTEENFQLSIDYGAWATQKSNEQKFNEAFHGSEKVILIMSINKSGHFQGFARMQTAVGQGPHVPWNGFDPKGTRNFGIRWECLYDLPFHSLEHIRNPWNENKVVKISRDGQELPPEVGQELVKLFQQGASKAGVAPPRGPRGGLGPIQKPGPRPPGNFPDKFAPHPPHGPPPMGPHGAGPMGGPMMMNDGGMGPGMMPPGGFMGPVPGMMMRPSPMLHGMGPGMFPEGPMMPGMPWRGVMMDGGLGRPGMMMDGGMMGNPMRATGLGMARPPPRPPAGPPPGSPRSRGGEPLGRLGGQYGGNDSRSNGQNHGRRKRSRSRSRSPVAQGVGEKSRSPARGRNVPDILDMSYDEYLEYYKKVAKRVRESQGPLGRPDSQPSSHPGVGNRGKGELGNGMAGPGGRMGGLTGSGQVPMTEAEYVKHCQMYFRSMGYPVPNEHSIKEYYRQMRQAYEQQRLMASSKTGHAWGGPGHY